MPVMTTFHGFFQASEGPQLIGGLLARAAIGHQLEGNRLVFLERTQTGAFHGADVNEYVLRAVIRRDEAVTLGLVEPLNLACSQNMFSLSS